MNIPNLLTLYRIVVMIPLVLTLTSKTPNIYLALFLIASAYFSDAIDGIIARRFNQATDFGARFDIAADRIIEFCLWVVFCSLGIFPSVMAVIAIVRGILTDSIREFFFINQKLKPFEVTANSWGNFIVSSRISRGLYGAIKLIAFVLALFAIQYPSLLNITLVFGWISIGYNLLRGLPVLMSISSLLKNY
ncbi:MAG TPA: CDP-alcohol phosphatidyltransferase family protein [Candidatus Woesebacteria bacterium]|nr:CDP-alcohol phosphatidyltransferase family protein [Candidatus Woesebacteria bacterium]HPJ16618.1 CDP-alcohol phosphatidyltransferase family protein [Candidatus Woesebacteria bacterium]